VDDIDLHLQCRQQIDAIADRLSRILDDPAVTRANAAYCIFELEKPDAADPVHRRQRVAVGAASGQGDNPDNCASADDEASNLVRFVQFAVEPGDIVLDLPTSTLAIAEGERLLQERTAFHMERVMTPSVSGGAQFHESLQREFRRGDHRDKQRLCLAAALEAAWIFYELWFIEPNSPIHVTVFTHAGTGRVALLSGVLLKR